jgi:hypothetical protein
MASGKAFRLFLDENQAAALGLFSAHWAYLESEMDFTVAALRQLVEGDFRLPFPFKERAALWKKLSRKFYSTASPKWHAQIDLFIEQIETAHAWRSLYQHGRILGDPSHKTDDIAITKNEHRKAGWTVVPHTVSPKQIRSMAEAMGRMTIALVKLNKLHLPAEPFALPCKFPRLPSTYRHPDLPGPKNSGPSAQPTASGVKLVLMQRPMISDIPADELPKKKPPKP